MAGIIYIYYPQINLILVETVIIVWTDNFKKENSSSKKYTSGLERWLSG